jgi:hypothetical protein
MSGYMFANERRIMWSVRIARMFYVGAFACLLALGGCSADVEHIDNKMANTPASVAASDEANAPESLEVQSIEHRIEGKPVAVTFRSTRGPRKIGDQVDVSVTFKIAPLWEIRTRNAIPEIAATRIELKLPAGIEPKGDWQSPPSTRSISPDGHSAYTDEATFKRTLVVTEAARPGEQLLQCIVTYQACNERQCLPPTSAELHVPLHVE